jgi:hypothetical protein
MGFESLTSAVQRRPNTLSEVSGVCKIPSNHRICSSALFLRFQAIHSGCCTVAVLGPPSGYAHRICTRLHIYAALSPVVIKETLEVMDSGVPTEPQRGANLQYAACALT